jgi:hypothetical protein
MRRQDDTTKERLRSDLETLANYCQPPEKAKQTLWPDGKLLQSIENGVTLLIGEERKRPLLWKTFRRLGKRMPKLLLVLRVDNLVKRARERLEESESALSKLARQDREDVRKFLGDIERLKRDLSNAKARDWQQYETVLKGVSRNQKSELGDSLASQKAICYVHALELVVDDYQREPLRKQSRPLLEWLARIEHPKAKNLLALDYETECEIERKARASQEEKALRQLKGGRERTKRHRDWFRGRWVYAGDWIRFRDAADFRAFYGAKWPLPEVCIGLDDSDVRDGLEAVLDTLSCTSTLPGSKRPRRVTDEPDGFFYQRTRHVARCCDCQQAEWIEQGFEFEGSFPFDDGMATAERIAEREREAAEELERERRWLQTTEGQQWLREANRRFVASLKEKARQQGWTQEQLRAEAKAYGLIR